MTAEVNMSAQLAVTVSNEEYTFPTDLDPKERTRFR